MKLEPLFDQKDVLNGGDSLTVAYLFVRSPDASETSKDNESVEEITEASETPENNQVIDQVDLPFGIGDIFYLQEPFRICAWDLRNNKFAFEYKDGTVGRPVSIYNHDIIEYLIGETDLMEGNLNNSARLSFEQEEIKRICKWHPSYDMPREAIRVTKKVQSATPVRIADMTEEQIKEIGCIHMDDLLSRVQMIIPEAGKNNWMLLVKLSRIEMPKIELWQSLNPQASL